MYVKISLLIYSVLRNTEDYPQSYFHNFLFHGVSNFYRRDPLKSKFVRHYTLRQSSSLFFIYKKLPNYAGYKLNS